LTLSKKSVNNKGIFNKIATPKENGRRVIRRQRQFQRRQIVKTKKTETKKYIMVDEKSGLEIDFSGMNFSEEDLAELEDQISSAHIEMGKIESGEIKNPDENRRVTHFTDRIYYPSTTLFGDISHFATDLKDGKIKSETGKKFDAAVINGIGGSALGPQFVQFAANGPYWNEKNSEKRNSWLKIYFTDNTDTAGIADLLDVLELDKTLILNISKSGGTQETKNNMTAFAQAYSKAGLKFSKHACAITMEDSELDKLAKAEGWLKIFPLADSIGGRTSETSVVGHLPAALAGIDFKSLLEGACRMDKWTRNANFRENPSYFLALMWFIAGGGRGGKNMVIVPYSDRLILLSRYLQQLVMESIGKERDLDGKLVCQGLNVFGNKGGTDAHAFMQQLNDGKDDFFATFIEVMRDAMEIEIADGITMGDYLHGFQAGLTKALVSKNRDVISVRITKVDPFNMGMIIALYERAVAFYAELIHINAFHQPGVQAYKLASKEIIKLIKTVEEKLPALSGFEGSAADFAAKIGIPDKQYDIEGILAKFAENKDQRTIGPVSVSKKWGKKKTWLYQVS
jgi:glucose-6-phosphate isomerase